MATGNEYDDLDLTTDLDDGNDGQSMPHGAQGATSDTDGVVLTERAESEHKPRETTLRDQLSNAFKGLDANAKEATPVTPLALSTDAEGRYRRTDGTFASADEVATFTKANAAPDAVSLETVVSQLPAAVAEEFKSLPAKSQEFLARTMEDLNSRATRYSEYDQLESVLGPRRDGWAANGMNSLVAVNQLFQLSDFASTNPVDFVLWFADNNGIDLDVMLDERDAANQEVSPEVRELRSQVNDLSQNLARLTEGNAPAQHNDNLRVVQNFASEKDGAGNLKRPYLADVAGTVLAGHVTAVRSANPTMAADQVLAKAYESACWADPQVRTKMQAEIDRQRRDTARRKTTAARDASSTIRGGSNGSGGNPQDTSYSGMSLRDTLKAQFAAHS